jgi:uncharacterized protein (TIGR00725 family)
MAKEKTYNHLGEELVHLKYKICVSGAAETGHCAKDVTAKAEAVGRVIAEHNLVLVTGATTGLPYWAAKGAKSAGGIVIGFSPAASQTSHVKTYRLPLDYHDLIVYTGLGYAGRNMILTRASDAILTICGRIGTLSEFAIAFEDEKPQGVLTGTGGMADMIPEIVAKAHRGPGKVVYESDPNALLDKLIAVIKKEERKE